MVPSHLPPCHYDQSRPVFTWEYKTNALLIVWAANSISKNLHNSNGLSNCRGVGVVNEHLFIISEGLKSEPQRVTDTGGAWWWQQVQPLQNSSGELALNREEPWRTPYRNLHGPHHATKNAQSSRGPETPHQKSEVSAPGGHTGYCRDTVLA